VTGTGAPTAPVLDLALARLVKLEERIGENEAEALMARWQFGRTMLEETGSGQAPRGYMDKVAAATDVHPAELRRRRLFAERFPELDHGMIKSLGSWYRVVNEVLPSMAAKDDAEPEREPLPEPAPGTYRTMVADPPWKYANRATRGAAEDHYDTMTVEELCALKVEEWAADEAHLYLWTTNGFLREAFDVLSAWGFAYKTCLTWVKPQLGMGNYFRSSTEHVLFGVRGGMRTLNCHQRNWFEAKRGKHSAKPGAFFDLVELASPPPYLEMFARSRRMGWDVWGREA
jgi:N6-adenosine-specific RNA methylase IME4